MNILVDIQSQIKELQKKELEIRSQEFDQTRLDIVEKMQAFGITIRDLQDSLPKESRAVRASSNNSGNSSSSRKSSNSDKKSRAGIPVAAKYRSPQGDTWTGRGLMPRWLKALTADGKTKEDFEIKSSHGNAGTQAPEAGNT